MHRLVFSTLIAFVVLSAACAPVESVIQLGDAGSLDASTAVEGPTIQIELIVDEVL